MNNMAMMDSVYNAETILQAIMALTVDDRCAVPANVIHNLARLGCDSASNLLDCLTDLPSDSGEGFSQAEA